MKRTKSGILLLILAFAFAGNVFAQTVTDKFFPASTKGYFAVSNINTVRQQWQGTDLGSTFQKPAFDEFRKAFAEQAAQSWISRFGMTFSDMTAIASGEIGGGLIALPGQAPGYALVIDTAGRDKEVNNFLTKLIRKTTASAKGKSSLERVAVGGRNLDVTVLTLPPDEQSEEIRTIYYARVGNYLISTDKLYLVEQVTGENANPLASLPAYQATMKRCIADYTVQNEPQIRFFAVPLEFGEAIYSLSKDNAKKTSPYAILAKQGFDGIAGVGGIIDFGTENYESTIRVKAYIPNPPALSLKMIHFLDAADIPVPNWVSDQSNRSSFLNIDVLTLFNNMGPLFDDFLETPGVWEETLRSLEKDEKGPKVNLKTDLIAHLGPQASIMRRFVNSDEKMVAGIQIKEGKAKLVSSALHRMFDTDPDFTVISYDNDSMWLHTPKKQEAAPSGNKTSRRPRPTSSQSKKAEQPAPQANVSYVFFVANDTLFVSNDVDMLQQTLESRKAGNNPTVDQTADYAAIDSILKSAGADKGYFLKIFADNQDSFQANYELLKANQLNQGKTLFAYIVRSILTGPDKKPRTDFTIDGSTLPSFDELSGHIGPSGCFGQSEADGWFFKGIAIRADQVQ